jgi:hypothetical protein
MLIPLAIPRLRKTRWNRAAPTRRRQTASAILLTGFTHFVLLKICKIAALLARFLPYSFLLVAGPDRPKPEFCAPGTRPNPLLSSPLVAGDLRRRPRDGVENMWIKPAGRD